ncbi:hypothetical protein BDV40DRAFT_254842 [Aspergillus tamarii]|uniref:Uncharacterized protein n=1 Tax=Aspergillus tamarii TaxID=41984 RepID=A0A5N6V7M0_ASPTM|nr:hypothetical protein BDV40DRAFT_254842 [Aspergillus tamarii]
MLVFRCSISSLDPFFLFCLKMLILIVLYFRFIIFLFCRPAKGYGGTPFYKARHCLLFSLS